MEDVLHVLLFLYYLGYRHTGSGGVHKTLVKREEGCVESPCPSGLPLSADLLLVSLLHVLFLYVFS